MRLQLPDPRYAPGDIVAVGDDLSVETLTVAYRKGIFPWPHDEIPLPWFSPRRRAVLFFDELHIGRSLQRAMRSNTFTFTVNRDFSSVIRACADSARPDQDGTWISPDIVRAYVGLHDAGVAHSVEAWQGSTLTGGLYGVDAGGVFTGESMFHHSSGASKLALLYLVEHLRARGARFLDCQVMTPHMAALGAREIPRGRFLDMLAEAQAGDGSLFG